MIKLLFNYGVRGVIKNGYFTVRGGQPGGVGNSKIKNTQKKSQKADRRGGKRLRSAWPWNICFLRLSFIETKKEYHIWSTNIQRENVESTVQGDLCRCLNTTARATLASWLFFTTCQGRPRFRCNIICILVIVLATAFHIFMSAWCQLPPLHLDYVTGPWQKHYWKEWLSIYMQCNVPS